MEELFTLGEVIENLKRDQYAIGVLNQELSDIGNSKEEGSIIGVDDEGWMFIMYSYRDYKTHSLNIYKSVDDTHTKCWAIRDMDKDTKRKLDELDFID